MLTLFLAALIACAPADADISDTYSDFEAEEVRFEYLIPTYDIEYPGETNFDFYGKVSGPEYELAHVLITYTSKDGQRSIADGESTLRNGCFHIELEPNNSFWPYDGFDVEITVYDEDYLPTSKKFIDYLGALDYQEAVECSDYNF